MIYDFDFRTEEDGKIRFSIYKNEYESECLVADIWVSSAFTMNFCNEDDFANFQIAILNARFGFNLPKIENWAAKYQWYDATATSGDGYCTFYRVEALYDCLAYTLASEYEIDTEKYQLTRMPNVPLVYRKG
jgi:hypothetical protein